MQRVNKMNKQKLLGKFIPIQFLMLFIKRSYFSVTSRIERTALETKRCRTRSGRTPSGGVAGRGLVSGGDPRAERVGRIAPQGRTAPEASGPEGPRHPATLAKPHFTFHRC